MTLIEKLEKMTLESKFPIYGREKSKNYLALRQKIFDATSDKELTDLMKTMEGMFRKGQLNQGEMMDLVDKIDQKKKLGGGRVKKTIKGMDKFPNKVRNK